MMSIAVAIVLVSLLALFYQRTQGSRPPRRVNWEVLNDEQVRQLVERGQRREAITLYHDLSHSRWGDARRAINFLMMNPEISLGRKKKAAYDAQDAGIRDLIEEGHIDKAVEVYRLFAGVDEYTARDAISAIQREIHLSDEPETGDNIVINDEPSRNRLKE